MSLLRHLTLHVARVVEEVVVYEIIIDMVVDIWLSGAKGVEEQTRGTAFAWSSSYA